MKTINVSDEDYETLMELSKELQLQDNNGQAFPYFWTPSSLKLEIDPNDEGEVEEIYYDSETYDNTEEGLEIFFDNNEGIWEKFCIANELFADEEGFDIIDYSPEYNKDWERYLKEYTDAYFYSSNWKRTRDYNPSLFMSDVKKYCEQNTHHLGRKPLPYSDSIWRMPKMESLVKALVRLNKQPEEEVNHECRRFTYRKEK